MGDIYSFSRDLRETKSSTCWKYLSLTVSSSKVKKKEIGGNEFSRKRKSKLFLYCHSKHDKTTKTGNFKLTGSWLKQLPSIIPGKFTPECDS